MTVAVIYNENIIIVLELEVSTVIKPRIAVSMGDAAGIGPEITAKAIASDEVFNTTDCIVVGDGCIMAKAVEISGVDLRINIISDPDEGIWRRGTLNLIDLRNIDMGKFRFGKISGMCGRASYEYIEKCVSMAMERKVDAVATAPINKEALRAGGVDFIGHTEILGALTNTSDPLTMFETNGMRIFFLTRHVSLSDMLGMITKERIKECVRQCAQALQRLGVTDGTMAVAGLNPHSGEHGLFGWEEVKEIIPAIEELQAEGYAVTGPIGADSVFHQAALGKYNSVLSLYHDQGHIAAKTLDFDRTIAITNGMPILRTSVDHGTAFDIAGRGTASAVSMIEAIKLAAKYAGFFNKR